VIFPHAVFDQAGHWYVRADDEQSGEVRNFRIDRIESFTPTGKTAAPNFDGVDSEIEFFGADVQQATLLVQPSARRLVESYPYRSREVLADGSVKMTIPVGSERWLGRLLLRGGDAITVVEPAQWTDLGTRTAQAVLQRYR
jgi:proteasome accessory factor C